MVLLYDCKTKQDAKGKWRRRRRTKKNIQTTEKLTHMKTNHPSSFQHFIDAQRSHHRYAHTVARKLFHNFFLYLIRKWNGMNIFCWANVQKKNSLIYSKSFVLNKQNGSPPKKGLEADINFQPHLNMNNSKRFFSLMRESHMPLHKQKSEIWLISDFTHASE